MARIITRQARYRTLKKAARDGALWALAKTRKKNKRKRYQQKTKQREDFIDKLMKPITKVI